MHRILVIAKETASSNALHDVVRTAAEGRAATVLVVAPALNTRLRHWLSDTDEAREAACQRLIVCVERLADVGIETEGMVGDADPLQATVDALRVFPADEIIVSTHPENASNWLARGLVERVAERFGGPVIHLIADEATKVANVS